VAVYLLSSSIASYPSLSLSKETPRLDTANQSSINSLNSINCNHGLRRCSPPRPHPPKPLPVHKLHHPIPRLPNRVLLLLLPRRPSRQCHLRSPLRALRTRLPPSFHNNPPRLSFHSRHALRHDSRSHWLCRPPHELGEPMVAKRLLDTDCVLDDCPRVHGCGIVSLLETHCVYVWARELSY